MQQRLLMLQADDRRSDRAMENFPGEINYARDDAAGQAIAHAICRDYWPVASRNASDGQAMIDTAEGALQETHSILMRLRN